MRNYSDLIIVGYPAGYGGEFFSSLLVSNYTNYNPILRKSEHLRNKSLNNWYTFDEYNSIGSLKSIDSILAHCGDLILQENENYIKISSVYAKKHISLIWDRNPDYLIDNLITLCQDLYKTNKPKILNFHYHEKLRHHNLFKNFSMDKMFPGSKKIRLVGDSYYHDLFGLLYVFKTGAIKENIKMGNIDLDFFIECAFPKNRKEFINYSFEDFIDVDVSKLFLQDDNFNLANQQLSAFLNTSINLNKLDKLKDYREKNIKILESILGVDYNNNTEEKNTKLVFDYVKKSFSEQLRLYKNTI